MPPGWKEAYAAWAAAGWNGLAAPEKFGGQNLPHALNAACTEMWNAASMAFGVGPLLTMGAVEALAVHGSDALKQTYLPKLVSGEWTGSMQLTEPQAGSDVGALRTKAERADDGSYRITGQKIFIWCWRVCPMRRRARAAFRYSSSRNSWSKPMARSARATTCAAIPSNTSSAFTARPPAPWCSAIRAAPPAI
jgi:hypothetical protein